MSSIPLGSDSATPDGTTEFPCTACGRMLKVPLAAIGKQAKCPQCAVVQAVPQIASASTDLNSIPTPAEQSPTASSGMDDYGAASESLTGREPGSRPPSATVAAPPPMAQATSASPPASGFQPLPKKPVQDSPMSLKGAIRETKYTGRETDTKKLFDRITDEISKIYVGQDELVLGALVALFSSGHVLIESVPGLGKTLFVRTLGRILGCQFGRIQFTADLMPSDITGAPIFDMKEQEFRFRAGPVFTQLLLADEINRSPAKTHAALLEIMQEYRVTIDGTSHQLERPFLVLATQNPIESEGTYNLPEAQLDRFMFKLFADYPDEAEEVEILTMHSKQDDVNTRLEEELQTITSPAEIMRVIRENADVRVDEKLIDYINKIVRLTRQWPQFHLGASPRAGISLMQGARTLAAFTGRDYAVPDDVVQIVLPALRHRVTLTAEAEVEGHLVDHLLTELVRSVDVPRL
jgi:MoxR-like ATPase